VNGSASGLLGELQNALQYIPSQRVVDRDSEYISDCIPDAFRILSSNPEVVKTSSQELAHGNAHCSGVCSRSAQPSPSADGKKIFKKIPLLYQQYAIFVIAPMVCIFTLYIFVFYL
jgi:hypothetical protein